ncbi:hypothetical protein BDA99DRAFT_204177 [Phascolomyces articulosus]|uniref:B-related factor 1 n=1 Tax=Phascolomyces articulosus TaxID=60185 RepID=A0AAD5K4P3_9FUNG|nr:hypothetical protein BDA99DRAFT_204177 [Phascolomyces articulosus]
MRCRCGSSKTETDAASGTIVCVGCGEVLEENTIVSEVTFQEISGGKTVLSGSFAGDSGRISGGGPFGRGRGKEGQEQAMENGRHKIARLAFALHLPERYRESAQRYYNLAVVNRFTRGRKSEHVAAVCLYIVCRNEKSSQMLIDFSDLLQANVFVLGSTFLKLVRTLNLKLPLIDPSIYISRFAAALDFGDYTQRVAHDAVRLVQRMDRDWIRTGRRPAGICGACLLMAARINGFRRTTREMIYIVKVAEITIHNRLKEFKQTESANLSVRDFRNMWLENEADPPAFIKARKEQEANKQRVGMKRKRKSSDNEENVEGEENENDEEEDEEEEEDVENQKQQGQKSKAKLKSDDEFNDSNEEDDDEFVSRSDLESMNRQPMVIAANSPANVSVLSHDDLSVSTAPTPPASTAGSFLRIPSSLNSSAMNEKEDTQTTLVNNTNDDDTQATAVNPVLAQEAETLGKEMDEWMHDTSFIKESEAFEKEAEELEQATAAARKQAEDDENLSDVDDEEIEAMILTPSEVKIKSRIWYDANKDYLEEMKVKLQKIEMDRRNGIFIKRKGPKKRKFTPSSTPAEAAKQLLTSKKFSKKINQAVFDGMFESAEAIEKIKEVDKFREILREANIDENTGDYSAYEVVEESGDTQASKKRKDGKENEALLQSMNKSDGQAAEDGEEEDDDDEDIDLDDMADDERMMLEGRRRMGWTEMGADEDYYDYDDD